jgi:hypothetical protein
MVVQVDSGGKYTRINSELLLRVRLFESSSP